MKCISNGLVQVVRVEENNNEDFIADSARLLGFLSEISSQCSLAVATIKEGAVPNESEIAGILNASHVVSTLCSNVAGIIEAETMNAKR